MNSLSTEQLEQIAALIHARIDEFGTEYTRLTKPSVGVVRIAVEVIKQWHVEKEESWAMQRISEITITHEMAMKLSEQGYRMGYAAAKKEAAPQVAAEIATPTAPIHANGNSAHVDDPPWDDRADVDFDTAAETSATITDGVARGHAVGYQLGYQHGRNDAASGDRSLFAPDEPPQDDADPIDPADFAAGIDDPDIDDLALERALADDGMGRDDDPSLSATAAGRAEMLDDYDPMLDFGSDDENAPATPLSREVAADATVSEDIKSMRMGKDEKAERLRDICAELLLMSHDGVTMPTIAEWDKKRPAGMITAGGIMKAYDLSWNDLAARARLQPKRKERA